MSLLPARETITIPNQGEARTTPASNRRGCVDPRLVVPHVPLDRVVSFRQETDPGEARSAGADMGDVAILLATNPKMSPREAVIAVARAAQVRHRPFTIHNDTEHDIASSRFAGCGLYGLIASGKHEGAFGLAADKFQAAGAYVLELAAEGSLNLESAVLGGPHEHEVGVLVVRGRESTVVPELGDGSRFFRHDESRHHDILEDVADFAGEDSDHLWETALVHRDEALTHLAPGRPIYLADLANYAASAELVSWVPEQ